MYVSLWAAPDGSGVGGRREMVAPARRPTYYYSLNLNSKTSFVLA
jgi:hypothetical protein